MMNTEIGKELFVWISMYQKAAKAQIKHEKKWAEKPQNEGRFTGKLVFIPYIELKNHDLIFMFPIRDSDLRLPPRDITTLYVYTVALYMLYNKLFQTDILCVGLLSIPSPIIMTSGYSTTMPLDWLLAKTRTGPCGISTLESKDILVPGAQQRVEELLRVIFVSRNQASKWE